MADDHKGIALVILGIVAIIAVVGLVLLFVGTKGATGEGIYGGAMKKIAYPNWVGRGVPANRPGEEDLWPTTASKDLSTNWNYYGKPDKDPVQDVPSAMRKCGTGGMLIGYAENLPGYYRGKGYMVIETGDKAGLCIYPQTNMVGGVAGQI